ncbi:MAG: TIGR02147 family protein [Bdellovibrionia bacterium]
MIAVFDFDDYKTYVRAMIEQMPRHGHGQARKLALHLEVNSVVISQVLRGDKHFTPEQGYKVAGYFGLTDPQREFFLTLINKARAGTYELQQFYQVLLVKMRADSRKMKKQMIPARELTDEQKAVFYSSWHYSAVRFLIGLPDWNDVDKVAIRLNISKERVNEALEFLLECGLIRETKGAFELGVATTYSDPKSRTSSNNHRNWRLKALEKIGDLKETNMHYTAVICISQAEFEKIRAEFIQQIVSVVKRAENAEPDNVFCLGLDWFAI